MDFTNKYYGRLFTLPGGIEVWLTDTLLGTWFVMGLLILLAIIVRLSLKSFVDKPKPGSLQNIVETAVEAMHNFTNETMGPEFSYFGAYFFGLFGLILFSNLSGLVGLRPPTADLATTASFGLTTFFLLHILGAFKRKGKYWHEYIEPVPVFLPLNILGELARPISLSFRMFGNILGGMIIMGLIYNMAPIFLKIGIPSVLHIYFDVFAGVLQSFIFTILSMTFIREKAGTA